MREIALRIFIVMALAALSYWSFAHLPDYFGATFLSEFPVLLPALAIFALLSCISFLHERFKRDGGH